MNQAATAALRRCLRSRGARAACSANGAPSAQTCVAASICPARNLASTGVTSRPSSSSSSTATGPRKQAPSLRGSIGPRVRSQRRFNSTREASVVGKDEGAGIPGEAAREQEVTEAPGHLNEEERAIWELLSRELRPARLEVRDISGGCGSMYGIEVVSERFRGMGMLGQQRLVNGVLGDRVKGWHGVQLKTLVP